MPLAPRTLDALAPIPKGCLFSPRDRKASLVLILLHPQTITKDGGRCHLRKSRRPLLTAAPHNSLLRASKVHGPLRILTTNVGGSRVAILHDLGLGADVVFVQEHKLSNGQTQGMANACRTQGWHGVWAPALSSSEHHMGRSGWGFHF